MHRPNCTWANIPTTFLLPCTPASIQLLRYSQHALLHAACLITVCRLMAHLLDQLTNKVRHHGELASMAYHTFAVIL